MSAMTPEDALEGFIRLARQQDWPFLDQADRLRELVALGEAVEGMVAGEELRRGDWGPAWVVEINEYEVVVGATPLAALLEAAKERETCATRS